MRIIIIVFTILTCIVSQSIAGPKTYIGLYSNTDHYDCRHDVPAIYVPFSVWVWVLPSDDGMICVKFGVEFSDHYLLSGVVLNPARSVAIPGCSLPGDCGMCFPDCQTGWVWIAQMTFLPTEIHQDYISLTSTYGYSGGYFDVASCEAGYPTMPLTILNNLSVNQPCLISTQSSSWGIIKTLCND